MTRSSNNSDVDNIIVLRAVYGKQQGPLTLNPVYDRVRNSFKGVKKMTEEEAKKAIRVITPETSRTIIDGLSLDLSDEADKVDWEWIKENEEIAEDFDSAQMHPRALFYVENLRKEIERKINNKKDIFEAQALVFKASNSKLIEVGRLIGYDLRSVPAFDVESLMIDEAEKNPSRIISAFKDEDAKLKLFVYQLIDARILNKDDENNYRYNKLLIGTSFAKVIDWMKTRDNQDIVKEMRLSLTGSEEPIKPKKVEINPDTKTGKEAGDELI